MRRKFPIRRDTRPDPRDEEVRYVPGTTIMQSAFAMQRQDQEESLVPPYKKYRKEDVERPPWPEKANNISAAFIEKHNRRLEEYERQLAVRAPQGTPEFLNTRPTKIVDYVTNPNMPAPAEATEVITRKAKGIQKNKDYVYFDQESALQRVAQAGLDWSKRVGEQFNATCDALDRQQEPPTSDEVSNSAVMALYFARVARYLVMGTDVCRYERLIGEVDLDVLMLESKSVRLHAFNLKKRMWENAKPYLERGYVWPWIPFDAPLREREEPLEAYLYRTWHMDIFQPIPLEEDVSTVEVTDDDEDEEAEEKQTTPLEKETSNPWDAAAEAADAIYLAGQVQETETQAMESPATEEKEEKAQPGAEETQVA